MMILHTTADGCMLLWEPPPPVLLEVFKLVDDPLAFTLADSLATIQLLLDAGCGATLVIDAGHLHQLGGHGPKCLILQWG